MILDFDMPAMNGLEVQQALEDMGCGMGIVFLSGHSDIPVSVHAMKHGAIDFLTKPVDEQALLAAIDSAIERDRRQWSRRVELAEIRRRMALLTRREHEVFEHVVSGQLNKQIAGYLGIVEKTVKIHRSRVMEKMGVRSLAELVRMAERAGIAAEPVIDVTIEIEPPCRVAPKSNWTRTSCFIP